MSKIPVFYSFHYDNDVMRVQMIRNIGSFDNSRLVSPNDWETIKKGGDAAVKNWIDENMKYKRCVIVLIGEHTADRKWVKHEIVKAWEEKRALMGIYIHNLKCARNGVSKKGENPFANHRLPNGPLLSELIPCYDPNPQDAYQHIARDIGSWVEHAIATKKN